MANPITLEETGRLLGLAAARDQRTVGQADILAWQMDLNRAGVPYLDAERAVADFYAATSARDQRVTARDVIAIAGRLRADRLANFVYEPEDPDESPEEYVRNRRAQMAAVAEGRRPAVPHPKPVTRGPEGSADPLQDLLPGVGRRVPKGGA